jgi:hypothetical protein
VFAVYPERNDSAMWQRERLLPNVASEDKRQPSDNHGLSQITGGAQINCQALISIKSLND